MTAAKPLEVRELEKKGGGRAVNHREPSTEVKEYTPKGQAMAKPDDLGERGSIEWDNIWEAGKVWLHPTEDYPWVEQICRAYDDVDEFRAQIKVDGLMCRGYAGQVVANPLIKEIRACEASIRKCLTEIGFSPIARQRLGLLAIQKESGLQALQSQMEQRRELGQ